MDDLPRFGWEEDPDAEAKPWADWPRCPRCGTRRDTACPDCAVPGVDFALADLDPAADLPLPPDDVRASGTDGASADASAGASDGAEGGSSARSHACGSGPLRACCADHSAVPDDDELPPTTGASPAVLLVCPICDEAFPPRFFRLCRHCGHDFGSGLELDSDEESTANYPVIFTLLAVLAVLAGMGLYLLFLFRE